MEHDVGTAPERDEIVRLHTCDRLAVDEKPHELGAGPEARDDVATHAPGLLRDASCQRERVDVFATSNERQVVGLIANTTSHRRYVESQNLRQGHFMNAQVHHKRQLRMPYRKLHGNRVCINDNKIDLGCRRPGILALRD